MSTHYYGPADETVADLALPAARGRAPVVVLLHGGFWRAPYRRDLMTGLAGDLTGRGYATWNIEYRRVGAGGGWPTTLLDVASAMDALALLDAPLDLQRVAVLGHSAGGHLALWAAARHRLADGPGFRPVVRPRVALALAGVADLASAAEQRLGARAVEELLGGTPAQRPERYAHASPAALLPLGLHQVLVHGTADDRVPLSHACAYAEQAWAAGDTLDWVGLDGVDHFALIDPASGAWRRARAALVRRFPPERADWPA